MLSVMNIVAALVIALLPAKLEGTYPSLIEAWGEWSKTYGVIEPDRPVGYARPPRSGSF